MTVCKVGEILDTADDDERTALIMALREKTGHNYVWSARELSKAVKRTRFSVGATTIKEHRRGTCACFNEDVVQELAAALHER